MGVDYALFIVTRYRQGMLRGLAREEAVVQALDTSGRAVLFAGVIVCVAMIGLSMDYEVFLVSRMYEEWHHRSDNREAVTHGLAVTGKTITAAAAMIVRSVVVPALMLLLGRANWHMPGWLERRLPHLRVEGRSIRVPLPDAGASLARASQRAAAS